MSQAVRDLAEKFLNFQFEEYPEYATYRGYRLYENKLDLISPAFYKRREVRGYIC